MCKMQCFSDKLYYTRSEWGEILEKVVEDFRAYNEELGEINQELKKTQRQLIQSAKLASIGQLATGVAHEINNPLVAY
jgi:phosphoglycerate-specific signal transduction histidine kinase